VAYQIKVRRSWFFIVATLDLQKEIQRQEEQLEAMYCDPQLTKVLQNVTQQIVAIAFGFF
jgi:hypothetical protein